MKTKKEKPPITPMWPMRKMEGYIYGELESGTHVEIVEENGKIVLVPKKKYDLDVMLSQMTTKNMQKEIDTLGPKGKEVWYKSFDWAEREAELIEKSKIEILEEVLAKLQAILF